MLEGRHPKQQTINRLAHFGAPAGCQLIMPAMAFGAVLVRASPQRCARQLVIQSWA